MTKKQKRVLIRIIISAVLLGVLMIIKIDNPYIKFAAFMAPYLIIGYDILKKAVKGIFNRQVFDENFLMAIATVGAIILAVKQNSDYAEAIAVMLFYQIGELFQSYAVGKSRRNIASLMDIRPDIAKVEIDGEIKELDPEEVEAGSIIVISPGEKIPIDAVIIEGNATLNTSALTGESVPREVGAGDEIISGCINENGVIRAKTTKPFGESTVAKILDLVENSSMKKAKSEQFITKFARYYTPAVVFSALALGIVPCVINLILGNSPEWGKWIYRALTFLIISCPCALVISIPLTFFAGIGGASKAGILVKGASFLETLSKTKTVALDKTGTLTKGVFEVEAVYPEGVSQEELLYISAMAESYSSHPISTSIKNANQIETDKSLVKNVKEISGNGVTAELDGVIIAAGNSKLMDSLGIEYEQRDDIGTIVYVARDGKFIGSIVISDELKPTSKEAIDELKASSITPVMLTGDSKKAAKGIAEQLGIDEYYSELLPEDKVRIVEELISKCNKGEKLAFAGDGINDAPVLTRADIGVAMGALGSDAAIEAADVVLMDDDMKKLSKAINISKKCLRIVWENIIFALGVKAICLILGALGIANMWLAIFADVGVMVIAVINAIRALKTK
ncbi:MAG: cadmium-translocating P-type ATPase [Eubacterium sp.]|nr:cadmium-translocating P-type ATPase [Eubacterium sp.]